MRRLGWEVGNRRDMCFQYLLLVQRKSAVSAVIEAYANFHVLSAAITMGRHYQLRRHSISLASK